MSLLIRSLLSVEDTSEFAPEAHNETVEDGPTVEICAQCQGAFVNYYTALQTSARPNLLASAVVLVGATLTWLLMDTAQIFFLPALFYWSKRLKLSPETAAATLLAIDNGAPDMADALAAAQLQDLPLGLSDLGGCNLCCLSLGNSLCLLVAYLRASDAKDAVLPEPRHYLVLLGFYATAIALLSIGLQKATVNFWHICALPALYGLYLVYLILRRKIEEAAQASLRAEDQEREELSSLRGQRRRSSTHIAMEDSMACLSPPQEEPWWKSLTWAVLLPFTLVRMATIPPCDLRWDTPRRIFHSICPTGIYVLCRLLGYVPAPDFNTGVATAAVLTSATVLLFASGGTPPALKMAGTGLPWFYNVMTLLALVSSMLWLSALSDEITSSLEGLCQFYRISRLRSGFTLLAWGNCAGDLVAGYSISLMGEFSLALNGLVASQFFNTAVGFSAALMSITWKQSHIVLFADGWPLDIIHPLLACVIAIFFVVALLASVSLWDPRVSSPFWGAALAAIYGSFFVFMWRNTSQDVPHQLLTG